MAKIKKQDATARVPYAVTEGNAQTTVITWSYKAQCFRNHNATWDLKKYKLPSMLKLKLYQFISGLVEIGGQSYTSVSEDNMYLQLIYVEELHSRCAREGSPIRIEEVFLCVS